MALTRTVSELKESLLGSSEKKRRKSDCNKTQYSVLEPRQLLAAMPLINEFLASNSGGLQDDNGNSTDWIELYNSGSEAVDLAGYTLTDDPADPSKFVLPSTTLGASEYLVVFAGLDLDPTAGTDIYTDFGLSSSGEYLGFYDPVGNLINEFAAGGGDYPEQVTDVSYGFLSDGLFSTERYFSTPTPNDANDGQSFLGVVAETTVSVERGFYDSVFTVDLVSTTPGAFIVYTTDGTEPTVSNGVVVAPANGSAIAQASIPISTTTSLRSTAFEPGFLTRGSTTHTYVFLNDVITSDVLDTAITSQYSNAELRAGLLDIPTLSFNYETVIKDSDQPEQPASIEWLAPDGSEGFQINAGISGFGGNHISSQGFEKENYRVEFRNEYDGRLEFPLFEGFDNGVVATDSFESVEFRGGSHDRILRGFGLSNRFVDDTLLELGHAVPHGRFVHIYSNGEYFGQFHMRERWDADFLAQYYGGEEDDYEAINGNVNNGNGTPNGWDPGDVYDGDGTAWAAIQALADTDGSGNPTGGYQELKQVVNLPQYLDYILIYMAGNTENEYRGGGSVDGSVPYTFYLNDADGWLRSVGDRTGNAGPGNILGTLVDEADPEFMTLYADRIQNLFGEGGVLSAERSVERLQNRIDETQLSFVLESARYSATNETRTPESFMAAANDAIENILPAIPVNMINRLRARGLFPSFDAPSFEINGAFQNGGTIEAGDLLTFSADDTIFYTVDGSDPRSVGGGISSNAISFNPGLVTTNLFGFGSAWNYLDTGEDEGTEWQSSSFDDSTWESGSGQLGYGGNGEAGGTTVDFGGVADNKYITTYFRKTFNVPAGNYVSATLNLIRDDGVVVYLDGVEIGRNNFEHLPANEPIEFDDLANNAIGGSAETTPISFPINLNSLQPGTHTLAIEVHQANIDSSDLSFDAELEVSAQSSGSGPFVLNSSTNVKSRTLSGGDWSALNDATFVIPVSQSELRISEIHYNPTDPTAAEIAAGFVDSDDFEFIEIYNPNPIGTINLNGTQFDDGITFGFGDVELSPGERAVIVQDTAAFQFRYGTSARVLGVYDGSLSNGGEQVRLVDSLDQVIHDFTYSDATPWPVSADGDGPSLEVISLNGDYSEPAHWRASAISGGTPGDAPADVAPQVTSAIRDGGSISRPDLWTTFAVQFSADVDVNVAALSLVNNSASGTSVDLSGITMNYIASTSTATWDLSNLSTSLPAAFYSVTLNSNLISGSGGGGLLDGNGNGSSGGSYTTEIYQAIPGDANLDGQVNVLGDGFALVRKLGTNGGSVWADGDFNADGNVSVLGDGFVLVGNLGDNVIPPVSSVFSQLIAQAVSQSVLFADAPQVPVLYEARSWETDRSEYYKKKTIPIESVEPALAGSQSLDDAFASNDWLI